MFALNKENTSPMRLTVTIQTVAKVKFQLLECVREQTGNQVGNDLVNRTWTQLVSQISDQMKEQIY